MRGPRTILAFASIQGENPLSKGRMRFLAPTGLSGSPFPVIQLPLLVLRAPATS
jgi:hypothetical protein